MLKEFFINKNKTETLRFKVSIYYLIFNIRTFRILKKNMTIFQKNFEYDVEEKKIIPKFISSKNQLKVKIFK